MSTVREILRAKGSAVFTVVPQTSVFEALELMAAKNCGALIVAEGDRMVGIFSERDYARKVILQGKSSRTTTVAELMTAKVYFVKPENTADECMQLMSAHRIRHLPVLDNGKLAGVISIGDVVKSLLAEREFRIQQLENYIVGPSYPGQK